MRSVALSIAVATAAPGEAAAQADNPAGAPARSGAPETACVEEAAELRAHLTSESRRARRWNTAWAIGFGTVAAGQFTLAATKTNLFGEFDRDYQETMYVGAAKAGAGLLVRLVLPMRVRVPAPAAEPCADVTALRASLADAGRRERRGFFLTHLGGTALNLAGAALLTYRRSFRVGALSFAISYPISPLHAYTQPRRSWHRWRTHRASWTIGASGGSETTFWLGGTF
jgi:hypothetical protein